LFNVDVDVFKLSANNLFISSSEGGFISAGNPRPTGIGGTNKGFYVQGNNAGDNKVKVLIGDADGNRLTFDGDNFVMSASTFFLGSSGQYISGSLGDIEISSSMFHLDPKNNKVAISGSIVATGGVIGGFTITGDALSSTNFFISGSPTAGGVDNPEYMFISSSNFNVKSSGDVTASALSLTGGNIAGLKVDSGVISVGSILKFKDSGQITGSSVLFTGGKIAGWDIDADEIKKGTDISLDSTNKKITINSATFGASGIQLDYNSGTPRFYVGDGSDRHIKYDGTDVDIKSRKFELDATNIEISSTQASMSLGEGKIILSGSEGGIVKIGPDNDNLSLTAGTGIFLSGSGEFMMGDSNGNISFINDSFFLTGADVNINVNQLNISASGFTLSSPQASMSFGDSQEILLHATGGTGGIPILKLSGGEISASNFFVSAEGNLTASNASFDGIISSSEANIGGWTVDDDEIKSGNLKLNSATPNITLGGSNEITLTGDGSGHLAGGNIGWDTSGNITFGDSTYENVYIANNGVLQFRDGTTVYGELNNTDWTLTGGTITIQGTTGTVGHDRLVIGSADLSMYTNNTRRLHIDDSALAIGRYSSNSSTSKYSICTKISNFIPTRINVHT